MMDVISRNRRRWAGILRFDPRFDAGSFFGALGSLLAILGVFTAFSHSGVSIVSGLLGGALGVLGYFLGARSLGGAAIVLCIVSLFVGLSASQGLFF